MAGSQSGNLEPDLRSLSGNLGIVLANLGAWLRNRIWELGNLTWEPAEAGLGILSADLRTLLGSFIREVTREPWSLTWESIWELANLDGTWSGNYNWTFYRHLTWVPWNLTWESSAGIDSSTAPDLLRDLCYHWRPQSMLLLREKQKGTNNIKMPFDESWSRQSWTSSPEPLPNFISQSFFM